MTQKHYSAPQAEWLEAENALSFLIESPSGDIPELDDSGITITW